MSQIVKCDLCGGIYNQKYVSSHRRLAHGKPRSVASPSKSEPDALEVIVSMYTQLSAEGQREVRDRLAKIEPARK